MSRRVGILGGTFDPIHRGHVDLGEAAKAALKLSHLLILPSNLPPHRPQPIASGFHRFAMVALAVADRRGWQASDLELRHPTPSYTATTLQRFASRGYIPSELFFVIGADAFAEITSWKDYPAFLDAAHFAVVSRPGYPVGELPARVPALASRMSEATASGPGDRPSIFLIDRPTANVSSTAIRQGRSAGRPITGMVTSSVEQHIVQHALYLPAAADSHALTDSTASPAGRLHDQD